MSRMEHYTGKLTKVELLENESLEEQCKRIVALEYENIALDYLESDTYEEVIRGWERDYVIHEGKLFIIKDLKHVDNDSIFNINKNDNGELDFEIRYYNGGCCFSEAIDRAFNKIDNKNKR